MSDTPRTDTEILIDYHGNPKGLAVRARFARELERELATALAERDAANEKLRAMAAPAVQGVLAKMAAPPLDKALEDMRANLRVLDSVRQERDNAQKAQHEYQTRLHKAQDGIKALRDELSVALSDGQVARSRWLQTVKERDRLRTALESIANMPHYDQDDAHRLRNMAAKALAAAREALEEKP